jgi:hypothetical protein
MEQNTLILGLGILLALVYLYYMYVRCRSKYEEEEEERDDEDNKNSSYVAKNKICGKNHNQYVQIGYEFKDPSLMENRNDMYFPPVLDYAHVSFGGITPDGFQVPYLTLNERSIAAMCKKTTPVNYIHQSNTY